MDGEISPSRKTRSTGKDQPKSALKGSAEVGIDSSVPLLPAGTSGQRPDSRSVIYASDNDRGSGPRFAEILLIFLIFQQAVSTHLNGSTRMW